MQPWCHQALFHRTESENQHYVLHWRLPETLVRRRSLAAVPRVERKVVFRQDSAPAHASKLTQEHLKTFPCKFIPAMDWMDNSPGFSSYGLLHWRNFPLGSARQAGNYCCWFETSNEDGMVQTFSNNCRQHASILTRSCFLHERKMWPSYGASFEWWKVFWNWWRRESKVSRPEQLILCLGDSYKSMTSFLFKSENSGQNSHSVKTKEDGVKKVKYNTVKLPIVQWRHHGFSIRLSH